MVLTSSIKSKSDTRWASGDIIQKYITLNGAEALSTNLLIENANSGVQIQVFGIFFSTDMGGIFRILSGSNVIWPLNMNISGGIIEASSNSERPLFVCNLGESLNMYVDGDLSAAENSGIYLQYKLREIVS